MARQSKVEIERRIASAAAMAAIVERDRLAMLADLKASAAQERRAHNERCADMLEAAGYTEAAAFLRRAE